MQELLALLRQHDIRMGGYLGSSGKIVCRLQREDAVCDFELPEEGDMESLIERYFKPSIAALLQELGV